MIYRIKQFYLSLTAKVSEYEKRFVGSYLNSDEEDLFFKLQTSEQKHSINVASDINNNLTDQDKDYLIRLALLHDIGKTQVKINPFEKGIIVILDKLTRKKLKNSKRFKKVNAYYHHGETGKELLKELGNYEEDFLDRIKNHHTEKTDDDLLAILQKWDGRN